MLFSPLILISGMGSFIDPELALAGLLMPVFLSNMWQGFRQGFRAALNSLKAYLPFLFVGGVMLVLSAQFVRAIPNQVLFLIIGIYKLFSTCEPKHQEIKVTFKFSKTVHVHICMYKFLEPASTFF